MVSALESVGRRQAGVNWLRVAPNRGECRTALFILSGVRSPRQSNAAKNPLSRQHFRSAGLSLCLSSSAANISLTNPFPL